MKNYLLALNFAFLLFASCTDIDDEAIVDQTHFNPEFFNLFNVELQNQTQSFHMDAEDGVVTFTSVKGVEFTIDGSCLKLNGQPVTGQVDIEYIELFSRGDMFATNKLTMGIYNSEKYLLQSGGEFYINAKKNGQQLTLDCGMNLAFPTALTGGAVSGMQPFNGVLDANGNISWEIAMATEVWVNTLSQGSSIEAYNTVLSNFGWFNCDKFVNNDGPQTTIAATVPQGYGNGNSLVLIAAKNMPNSLGSIFGMYPIGLECHIIFVSEQDGKFLYSIKENETLAANHQVTFAPAGMQIATPAEMVTILNALQ